MLLHLPNVLTADQVRQLRAALDKAEWVDGRSTVGDQGAQVKRNRQLPEHGPVTKELGEIVRAALKAHAQFFAAALPVTISPPLFNRYEGGETYGLHVDGAVRSLPDGVRMRTDISCTLFLSDPDDYDGGELEIVDTYGSHDVKLPAGDMILYPSDSLHQVRPVTRGARVASFFWVQSMIRDTGQRRMLFDLDIAIQALRGQVGDTPEVLALTSHYHNLLRLWAEV